MGTKNIQYWCDKWMGQIGLHQKDCNTLVTHCLGVTRFINSLILSHFPVPKFLKILFIYTTIQYICVYL